MAGGLVFGLPVAGSLAAGTAEAAQSSEDPAAATVAAVRELADVIRAQQDLPVLGRIRTVQQVFLRGTQQYPTYIEVGIRVWDQLYDWHIRTRQTLPITVLASGRYAITTLLSTFVLRLDADDNYIGPGSDTLQ
jgi:hypothetical protein